MKRIDPQSVPGIFRERGIAPVQHSYVRNGLGRTSDPACCLICLPLLMECTYERLIQIVDVHIDDIHEAVALHCDFDEDYLWGLEMGWGHPGWALPGDDVSPEYMQGVEDGRAALAACHAAGLHIETWEEEY